MTNIASSLNPDPDNPPVTTHNGSEHALFVSKTTSASEGASNNPPGGKHPPQFQIFDPDPDDIDAWEDYREATKATLRALQRVLFAFVGAGIGTLLWVNLIN